MNSAPWSNVGVVSRDTLNSAYGVLPGSVSRISSVIPKSILESTVVSTGKLSAVMKLIHTYPLIIIAVAGWLGYLAGRRWG